jgi:hypothetical protein
MPSRALPLPAERVKMDAALSITGKSVRALQALAKRGEVPGAKKIGGEWTFNEAKLRAWVDETEEGSCRNGKVYHPAIRSGGARPYGGGSPSGGRNAGGRYERAMSHLLRSGSRPTESDSSPMPTTATTGRPMRPS